MGEMDHGPVAAIAETRENATGFPGEISLPAQQNRVVQLYRALWVEGHLFDGQHIGVGTNDLDDVTLTKQLRLDFSSFPGLEEKGRLYEEKHEGLRQKYLQREGEEARPDRKGISPSLLYDILQVQSTVDKLLKVNDHEDTWRKRFALYLKEDAPALSDFIGKSACAERALLAKYFFDRIGTEAIFMAGVYSADKMNIGAHAFLILPQGDDKTYIFDVTRYMLVNHANGEGKVLPRVLLTDIPLRPEIFLERYNFLVPAENIFAPGKYDCYGVGHSQCIEAPNIYEK